MFSPLPETTKTYSSPKGRYNKKQRIEKKCLEQRRSKRKHEKNPCVTSAMSTWAENFTEVATWQLKHQLAYWKAKAISLQYENSMLHEVIQRNHIGVGVSTTSRKGRFASKSEINHSPVAHSDTRSKDFVTQEIETDCSEIDQSDSENDKNSYENEGDDFEVSEEFIKFLTANAKYKEDAKREKETLNAKFAASALPRHQESVEDKIIRKMELYGDKHKKIMALEMYVMSNLKNESDILKPTYWPFIPFNLNIS